MREQWGARLPRGATIDNFTPLCIGFRFSGVYRGLQLGRDVAVTGAQRKE
jgi:hypothetical protein